MKQLYSFHQDSQGNIQIKTALQGLELINQALLNKGTGFSPEERETFCLEGLLPIHHSSIDEQCARMYENISKKSTDLEKYIGLISLKSRNETLFYRLLATHLEEMMPIIYTPTVGLACQEFSHIFRKVKGLWITPKDKGKIKKLLQNIAQDDIRLVVATDNESILGIGDQGAGGIAISAGKLALYCVGAGIHPHYVLPVSLDVGTNNEKLLRDPLYVGYREKRLSGKEYNDLVSEFVQALKETFPGVLLQWEDFKKQNAFDVLDRHRNDILSFNDDIEGTAAVALAGLINACKVKGTKLKDEKVLIVGAGAAGVGIARLLRYRMCKQGLTQQQAMQKIALTDSQGLLTETRHNEVERYKKDLLFVLEESNTLEADAKLEEIVQHLKPTIVIGTSGQAGVINQSIVATMCKYVDRPIIFPFSNPTSLSEAVPKDLIQWSDGKVLTATGSPFSPVHYKNKEYPIGQGNNVFIFPGIGLGAMINQCTCIDDEIFELSAQALADSVGSKDLEKGQLFPSIDQLQNVTHTIAMAIGVHMGNQRIKEDLLAQTWFPEYPVITPAS